MTRQVILEIWGGGIGVSTVANCRDSWHCIRVRARTRAGESPDAMGTVATVCDSNVPCSGRAIALCCVGTKTMGAIGYQRADPHSSGLCLRAVNSPATMVGPGGTVQPIGGREQMIFRNHATETKR